MPALVVMLRNERRTLPASSGVPDPRAEDQAVILPCLTGPQLVGCLACVVLVKSVGHLLGQFQCAAGLLRLGITGGAYGAPDVDGEPVVIEADLGDRLPSGVVVHPCDDW